ncbi:hypothetical protein Q3G72_026398 [Acer saccharum]|nr:hypothetical protein Q3G72_026398 [Acer saccharum]
MSQTADGIPQVKLSSYVFKIGQQVALFSAGPIDPAAGLRSYVETLLRKSSSEFNVLCGVIGDGNAAAKSLF